MFPSQNLQERHDVGYFHGKLGWKFQISIRNFCNGLEAREHRFH